MYTCAHVCTALHDRATLSKRTTAAAAAPAVAGEEEGEVEVEERELEEGKRVSSSTNFKKFCGAKESIA